MDNHGNKKFTFSVTIFYWNKANSGLLLAEYVHGHSQWPIGRRCFSIKIAIFGVEIGERPMTKAPISPNRQPALGGWWKWWARLDADSELKSLRDFVRMFAHQAARVWAALKVANADLFGFFAYLKRARERIRNDRIEISSERFNWEWNSLWRSRENRHWPNRSNRAEWKRWVLETSFLFVFLV